jgi:imidazolonepropionase-like amidohydrolase
MRRFLLFAALLLLAAGGFVWWSLAPPAPLAVPERGARLGDVTLVNPGGERLVSRSVLVEGAAIAAIEPSAGAGGPFAGRFVLPGLVDMHVHFPPPMGLGQTELFAFLFLLHGVTTVRDAGDVDGTASAPAREGVREARFPGPRVFACGPFLDGPEPLWPNSLVVRDAAEARAAVERVAAAGFDCLKVYDRLPAEALAAAREEAAKRGLPVIGHVPRAVSYLDARLDDVQHLTGIGRPAGDLRPFPEVLQQPALSGAELADLARQSAARGIANTPTRVTLERIHATRDLEAARRSPAALLLPRLYRDVIWSPEGSRLLRDLDAADYELLAGARERGARTVRALHAAGARVYAGSDVLNPFVVPGESLHRELALLVEAGLTPEEAWVAATSAPGELLGRRGLPNLGVLVPGAPADLLVFREDPTRDLAALASLEAVIADGRLYSREALEEQLARYRAYADGWLFDRVSVALTRRVLARMFDEDRQPGRPAGGED